MNAKNNSNNNNNNKSQNIKLGYSVELNLEDANVLEVEVSSKEQALELIKCIFKADSVMEDVSTYSVDSNVLTTKTSIIRNTRRLRVIAYIKFSSKII